MFLLLFAKEVAEGEGEQRKEFVEEVEDEDVRCSFAFIDPKYQNAEYQQYDEKNHKRDILGRVLFSTEKCT